jgi:hypothetical protein
LPSTACAFTVNWYGRLCFWTFGILSIALGLCGWAGHKRCLRASAVKLKRELLRRLFYLAFLCYPLAAPVIVSVFDCRTVAGTSYIDADYTLTCNGGTYALAATWAALWTVGFVAGFPVLVTLALHKRLEAVAFLVKDYKGGDVQRMWEVVDLVRKLLLSSAVLFVPEGSIERIAIALLVSVTFQVLQAYYQPYNSPHKNRMADAAGAALSLTYYLTLLIKASPLAKDQEALGVLLIMLLVFVMLASIAAVFAMKRQAQAVLSKGGMVGRQARVATDIEMQSSVIANPAYETDCDEERSGGGAAGADARVAELEAEMAAAKREHSKYTSARIAVELEKAQAAHAKESEKSLAALVAQVAESEKAQAALAAELQAERVSRTTEAGQLRAELAQLKKDE